MSQATNHANISLTEKIARTVLQILFAVLLAVFLFVGRDALGGLQRFF